MGYAPGDRVTQPQYGDGTVVSIDEFHTVINFDAHGKRTFSSPRVVLTTSSTAAPPPPAATARKRSRKATAGSDSPA